MPRNTVHADVLKSESTCQLHGSFAAHVLTTGRVESVATRFSVARPSITRIPGVPPLYRTARMNTIKIFPLRFDRCYTRGRGKAWAIEVERAEGIFRDYDHSITGPVIHKCVLPSIVLGCHFERVVENHRNRPKVNVRTQKMAHTVISRFNGLLFHSPV